MADRAPAPATAPAAQGQQARGAQPQQEESTLSQIWSVAQKALLVYLVSQVFSNFLNSRVTTPEPAPAPVATPGSSGGSSSESNQYVAPISGWPAWSLGTPMDMHVYFSTSPYGDVFGVVQRKNWGQAANQELGGFPHWVWENVTYGDWSESRRMDVSVEIPLAVRRNISSIWADIFLTKDGASPDPTSPQFNPRSVHHVRKLLTRYYPKAKVRKEHNLLAGKQEEVEEVEPEVDEGPAQIVPYWHPNLTLAIISETPSLPLNKIAPVVVPHLRLTQDRDETGTKAFYLPIIYPNDFWHLKSELVEINATHPADPKEKLVLPLSVELTTMGLMKMQITASMTHGFEEAAKNGQAAGELDEIKRMLVETNPWFLALTGLVSVLHMVFEMLAFKNDVAHWRKKDELVGVSVRTIATNVVVQLIILLYLLDNNTDTSWMILFGQGMGMLIEAWKITKAVDIGIVASPPGSALPYKLDIKDKHVLTEDEKKTQEYDALAFRYVSYGAAPLLAGYTVYSLVYETHRGWYSFVISTLTSFVYMFGFVQLIPQLIINYKLKSVAHMPMKAMIYKTLSTVVDDLFAFCIKMPILHRLACFRDDVVFLIFLYQRWIYRIDKSRVNEYGQVAEQDPVDEKTGESKKDK